MAAWNRGGRPGALSLPALWRKPAVKTAAKYGGYFLFGLTMGAGELFSGRGPFGAAAVAAAGVGTEGIFCLAGAVLGYLVSGGLFSGIRYIATVFMVFTVGFVTRGIKLASGRWFMPAIAALMTGAAGIVYADVYVGGVPGLLRLFMEVVLAGGCAYLFGFALDPEPGAGDAAQTRRGISVAILCACVLMALAGIELWGVLSVGRFLAAVIVMAAGFCGGPLTGCTAGAVLGVAMDMVGGARLFYCAAYALAGLLAGAVYRYGRLTFSLAFCAGGALVVLAAWSDGAHIEALYEGFAASVVFMLLPQAVLTPVGSLLRVGRGQGETAFRLYQADRLDSLAKGFMGLYEAASQSGREPGPEDMTSVFDRAADVVCRTCAGKEQCWQKDQAETVAALASISEGMSRRGTVSVGDLPVSFRQKCVAPGGFASAVNGELRGRMYRRQYEARLEEGRAAAYGQFLDMAEVMADAARQLSGVAGPDTRAERRMIRYLKSRELEGVCSAFRDGRGRLHATVEGADIEVLAQEPEYLEKLSAALGIRLCRVGLQEKGRIVLRQAEPLAVSVGIACMKKEGEDVSGDRGTYFKTDGGTLCVILSDGMGTGRAAAGESACAVSILEQLLRAGMEPMTAMRLLNSAAMLRNGEDWGYATVDLCCVDLFTGETCFYKYGAAPSYVRTGRTIRRVKCSSLAAGMLAGDDGSPDIVRMKLHPGSVALIASDGVLAEKDDGWLRRILSGADGLETKEIARQTLRAASARFGSMDDMTALALRVEVRQ